MLTKMPTQFNVDKFVNCASNAIVYVQKVQVEWIKEWGGGECVGGGDSGHCSSSFKLHYSIDLNSNKYIL